MQRSDRVAIASQRIAGLFNAVPQWETPGFILILILAAVLRFHDYTTAPRFSDNADEVSWAWVGQSVLQAPHIPTSWSYLNAYHSYSGISSSWGRILPVVQPWFDHPPLFAVLIGSSAMRAGQLTFQSVTAATIRPPVIILSLISLWFMWRLGRRLLGRGPALLAVLLMATSPAVVLASRLVESEALFAPMLLCGLLMTHRIVKKENQWDEVALLLVLCALAPLVKVPDVTLGLITGAVLASHGRWRIAASCVGAAALGIAAFATYGALIDWHQFIAVWQSQVARRHSVEGAFQFITSAQAGWSDSVPIHDAWWLIGWIAMGGFLLYERHGYRDLLLAWPAVAFAGAMAIMADPYAASTFGWYRLAIYPLIYLAAGILAWRAIGGPSLSTAMLILALVGGLAFNGLGVAGHPATPTSGPLVIVVGIVLTTVVLASWYRQHAAIQLVVRTTMGAILGAIVIANVVQSLELDRIYHAI